MTATSAFNQKISTPNGFSSGISFLQDLCLYQSTNWLAQLLVASSGDQKAIAAISKAINAELSTSCFSEPQVDANLVLAKTFMDIREYSQVPQILAESTSPTALFLRFYSSYLHLERSYYQMGNLFENPAASLNPLRSKYVDCLDALLKEMQATYGRRPDEFSLYLQGVILVRLNRIAEATKALTTSLAKFSYNWSAWRELLKCVRSSIQLNDIVKSLPNGLPLKFFLATFAVENQQNADETSAILDSLRQDQPYHPQVMLLQAINHYNLREFETSKMIFENYYSAFPASIDGSDIYSNVLFLLGEPAPLSLLAQRCVKIEKYRPETCCVIANFYALKSQHEKAIEYFQRALKLDKQFIGAWTLMGHEYMELGNTKAALESYRRAVDADPRDYRAWFGLGQTYEILGMPSYSIMYYQKAVALRAHDPRLWSALAGVYEAIDKMEDCLQCLKRATSKYMPSVDNAMMDVDEENDDFIACFKIWFKIAKIYSSSGRREDAVVWYETALMRDSLRNETGESEWNEALLFVGKHYLIEGNHARSEVYLRQLADIECVERDEAKMLMSDMS